MGKSSRGEKERKELPNQQGIPKIEVRHSKPIRRVNIK